MLTGKISSGRLDCAKWSPFCLFFQQYQKGTLESFRLKQWDIWTRSFRCWHRIRDGKRACNFVRNISRDFFFSGNCETFQGFRASWKWPAEIPTGKHVAQNTKPAFRCFLSAKRNVLQQCIIECAASARGQTLLSYLLNSSSSRSKSSISPVSESMSSFGLKISSANTRDQFTRGLPSRLQNWASVIPLKFSLTLTAKSNATSRGSCLCSNTGHGMTNTTTTTMVE